MLCNAVVLWVVEVVVVARWTWEEEEMVVVMDDDDDVVDDDASLCIPEMQSLDEEEVADELRTFPHNNLNICAHARMVVC